MNPIDDCVGDTGPEIIFGEELFLTAPAPLFTGTLEGEYVRLTLPPATGVAGAQVDLVVGPREPF